VVRGLGREHHTGPDHRHRGADQDVHLSLRRSTNLLPPAASWDGPSGTDAHAGTDDVGCCGTTGTNGAIVPHTPTAPQVIELTAAITDGLSGTILPGAKQLDSARIGTYQDDDNEGYTGGWD
jgi:hypothetical protein